MPIICDERGPRSRSPTWQPEFILRACSCRIRAQGIILQKLRTRHVCEELRALRPYFVGEGRPVIFPGPGTPGICEDLILLEFLSSEPSEWREELIGALMMHELVDNLEAQYQFFHSLRPFQPILRPDKNQKESKQRLVAQLQRLWKAKGWSLSGNTIVPQVKQIAQKVELENLYDYIYKITCDMVHFNPKVLLRAGWGPKRKMIFSFRNFSPYYAAFGQVYGVFLLVLNLELLGKHLAL